jgi:hypothetical protein
MKNSIFSLLEQFKTHTLKDQSALKDILRQASDFAKASSDTQDERGESQSDLPQKKD